MEAFQTADIYIGRTEDGGRYYVEAGINGRDQFRMTGAWIPKYARTLHSVGQNDHYLLEMAAPVKGISEADVAELYRIWNRWHLKKVEAEAEADILKVREILARAQA